MQKLVGNSKPNKNQLYACRYDLSVFELLKAIDIDGI